MTVFASLGYHEQQLAANISPLKDQSCSNEITFQNYVEVHPGNMRCLQTFVCHRIWDFRRAAWQSTFGLLGTFGIHFRDPKFYDIQKFVSIICYAPGTTLNKVMQPDAY